MTTQDRGHSLIFIQGKLDSTFSNFFSSETARPIEAKFHMEPPWDVGNENKVTWPCHAHFKNLFLRNQEADDLETWYMYTAWGTQVLPVLSNGDTGLTLTIFMTESNLFPNASAWVKAYTALSGRVFPSLF